MYLNCQFAPKHDFSGNFLICQFCPLIIHSYGTKFEKNNESGPIDNEIHDFGPKLAICPKMGIFWEMPNM